jgi:hypothetical protein
VASPAPATAPVPSEENSVAHTTTTAEKLFDVLEDSSSSPSDTTEASSPSPPVVQADSVAPLPSLDQSTEDWYNITAIGQDEPLEKTMNLPAATAPPLAQQRPSFRRSLSGGGLPNRSVGDTTPAVLGRHKSASQLTLEDPASHATAGASAAAATGAGK